MLFKFQGWWLKWKRGHSNVWMKEISYQSPNRIYKEKVSVTIYKVVSKKDWDRSGATF